MQTKQIVCVSLHHILNDIDCKYTANSIHRYNG